MRIRGMLLTGMLALTVFGCDEDKPATEADVSLDVPVDMRVDGTSDGEVAEETREPDVQEDTGPPFACRPKCSEYGELMSVCLGLSSNVRSTAFYLEDVSPENLDAIQRRLPPDARLEVNRHHRVVIIDRLDPEFTRALLADVTAIERELPALALNGERVVALPELIVAAEPGMSADDVQALAQRHGLRVARRLALPDTWLLTGEAAQRLEAVISSEPGVRYAEVNYLRSYTRNNDPLYPGQWHLDATGQNKSLPGADIMADEAWSLTTGDASVIIAVHDDGVDVDHPEFAGKIVYANGARSTENVLRNELLGGKGSHGTAVAGVAAALAENAAGGRGVCPECSVMPMLIFEGAVPGSLNVDDATVADDMTAAVDAGAAVINASWGPVGGDPALIEEPPGGPAPQLSPVVIDAFNYAETQGRGGLGTLIVYAAGNDNQDTARNPYLARPSILAVAAVDDQGRKSGYSSFGAEVDIAAPSSGGRSSGIIAPLPQRGSGPVFDQLSVNKVDGPSGEPYTVSFGGTSSAAPVVSGVIGLMISVNPAITAAQIRQILNDTANPVDRVNGRYDSAGHSPFYGHGVVNAYAAILAAQELAGTCDGAREEVCNGIDDNCDGTVDENCTLAEACTPCERDGQCASGVCAYTPGDYGARCVEACASDGSCGDGFACEGGVCLPDSGRCDACASDEACNGVDDDCSGAADDGGVCSATESGECYFDAECEEGWVCSVVGRCVEPCETNADCTDELTRCEDGADRFGESVGGICYVDQVTALCLGFLCQGQPDNAERFFDCVERNANPDCSTLAACVLLHLDTSLP